VAVHFGGGNAEIAEGRRNGAAGMLAGQEDRRGTGGIDPFHRLRIARLQQSGRVAVGEPEHGVASVVDPVGRVFMTVSQRNFSIIVNCIFPFD
jgi:hypothetical protein